MPARRPHIVISTPDPQQLLRDCAAADSRFADRLGAADHRRQDFLPIEDWLLAAHGVPAEAEPALAAATLGLAARGHGWLRVDALSLVISRDRLVALPQQNDDERDAATLIDTVLAQMPPFGTLHAIGDARLLDLDAPVEARFSPAWRTANRPLDDHLPQGPRGAEWRRWLTEAQMLLHEHPLNVEREARGLRPLNALWLAGGAAHAPAPRACGVRLLGKLALSAMLPIDPSDASELVWLHQPGEPLPDEVLRALSRSAFALRILEPSGQQCFTRRVAHSLRIWRKPLRSLTADYA
jgi:hypothetical protein